MSSSTDLTNSFLEYRVTPIEIISWIPPLKDVKKTKEEDKNSISNIELFARGGYGNTASQINDGASISIETERKWYYAVGAEFSTCLSDLIREDFSGGCKSE